MAQVFLFTFEGRIKTTEFFPEIFYVCFDEAGKCLTK